MLKKIIEYKFLELEHVKRRVSIRDIKFMARDQEPAKDFLMNFSSGGGVSFNIIAEIKKASPSAGVLSPEFITDFDPVRIAQIYESNGARALSVLTDEKFFQGSLENLKRVKACVKLPVLRKDFTLDEYHVFEARAGGADAVLLIAAVLDPHQLKDYHDLCLGLGMTPLIEIHAEEEIKKICAFMPKLVGINNRNLATLKVDVRTTETLFAKINWPATVISESGLKDHETLVKLSQKGIGGFLIGESLLKGDIEKNFKKLLNP